MSSRLNRSVVLCVFCTNTLSLRFSVFPWSCRCVRLIGHVLSPHRLLLSLSDSQSFIFTEKTERMCCFFFLKSWFSWSDLRADIDSVSTSWKANREIEGEDGETNSGRMENKWREGEVRIFPLIDRLSLFNFPAAEAAAEHEQSGSSEDGMEVWRRAGGRGGWRRADFLKSEKVLCFLSPPSSQSHCTEGC